MGLVRYSQSDVQTVESQGRLWGTGRKGCVPRQLVNFPPTCPLPHTCQARPRELDPKVGVVWLLYLVLFLLPFPESNNQYIC